MRLIRLLKNDLAKESADWVEKDFISREQAEKICDYYDVDFNQKKDSTGYNVLVGLGYLFIGLSIITLIGANWDEIPRALRMAGLILLTMTTHGFAIRKYQKGNQDSATILFFLGNWFYGASIILIAQIYHLGEHMPDGVYWWALGCIPIALLTKSRLLMLQSLTLAATWVWIEVEMGFYPATFPLFILASTYILIVQNRSLVLFLGTIASIGLWVEYSLSYFWRNTGVLELHIENFVAGISLVILFYAFSFWLNKRENSIAKDYGAILGLWGLRFGLLVLLVMSFEDPWEKVLGSQWHHLNSMAAVIGLFSILTIWIAHRAEVVKEFVILLSVFFLVLASSMIIQNEDYAVFFQILDNILLIVFGVGLVIKGIESRISHYFYLGIATILIAAFIRYIDLIGDYVGGAAMFFVLAIIMIGSARYWKKHQNSQVIEEEQ